MSKKTRQLYRQATALLIKNGYSHRGLPLKEEEKLKEQRKEYYEKLASGFIPDRIKF